MLSGSAYHTMLLLLNNRTWKPGDANGLNEQKNSRVTYGNGFTVRNEYDDFNRVTGIVYGTETDPRYEFRYNARGQAAWMKDSLLDRITETEYDLSDRPRRIKTHENGQHLYTGEVTYDALYGHLSTFTERVGASRTEYKTTFGYDAENRPTTLNYGSTNNRTNVTYDGLGRVSGRSVTVNGHTYSTAFGFVPGNASGKTTGLIQSITQNGEDFTYTYDDVGNITSVTRGQGADAKTTGYVYDAIGQLIRVNDQSDTTAGTDGTTWTYEYDCGGNILNKKRYAYTTGALGTAQETITYTYGDENWKDKLTAYNGVDIAYDAIGNPTNDGTWRYTWENGRQLKEMAKGTVGQAGYMKIEYRYNSEGLRIQKVVTETTASGTTTTTTDYILHGKNIVHMTQGNNQLHFFYDASNKPAIVEYNGTKYAYIHNLQGDIVGIIDSTGTEVVKYTYDAWGKKLVMSGTLSGSLGMLNPFRYRGYVYDEETGLYYLRSRYYNPMQGRFVNADRMISKNSFTYCKNKPIDMTDSTGTKESTYTEEEVILFSEIYAYQIEQTRLMNERVQNLSEIISTYSISTQSDQRHVIVSELFSRLDTLIQKKTNFHINKDTGCASFIRAGILDIAPGYSDNYYAGGASSMFNNNMIASGLISDIGGPNNLIVGMILGTPKKDNSDDGEYHIEHVGVYAGLYDFGNGLEPAVYSFNTTTNCGNLAPYTRNNWQYYGWHEGILAD